MNTRDILKALDNDIRLQMLSWLKDPDHQFPVQAGQLPEGKDFEGGVCVGCICEKAGISQSTASHYLDILLRAGLVETKRIGKWTYYRRNEETIRQTVAKLMGKSEFKGVSPVDAFCGMWDTRL